MENKNESFFKELAKAYAENEGAELKEELAEIERENAMPQSSRLDRKIKNKLTAHRLGKYGLRALPIAASLIFALLVYNIYMNKPSAPDATPSSPVAVDEPLPAPSAPVAPSAPAAPAPDGKVMRELQYSVELVSTSLPSGYEMTGVDYDNAAAIMEITNGERNRIVLTTMGYKSFDTEQFTELVINGEPAYGLVKNDFCILKYQKDGMLYTLTSQYSFRDLIELSENII